MLTTAANYTPDMAASYLGNSEGGTPLWFTGEGGLVTIAPPGAGKGQAQIIPNLLSYNGPIIVLDIKGENWDLTHAYRAQNFGETLRFAPFESVSNSYNPLDFIDTDDNATLWDDARLAAEMLIVPRSTDDFWEARGRDLLAAILAHVKIKRADTQQTMEAVMDALYPSAGERETFFGELSQSPLRALVRTGNVFEAMPEKQREGIYDSARRHMEIWQSARIERITSRSDWHPQDFWKPPWKTLYLSIPVGQVKTYASVLRIILGQHIKGLIDSAPSADARRECGIPPILMLIDEMPQLGYMEPLVSAIEVGRSYGLRPWLFAQSVGQLQNTYRDADGLMEMCYVQCFMNPEFDTARKLSARLGYTERLLRGKREALAEPTALMGPEFKDTILTFMRGEPPVKLIKQMAFADMQMRARMRA